MIGSAIDMNEVARIIEAVGGAKMNVEYRTFKQIRQKEECKDEMRLFWLKLEEMCDKKDRGIIRPALRKLCLMKPMSVEAYMRKFWSERQHS